MSENSKIEWTDHTANFWWGCVKVSPGCQNCYAETLVNRYGKGGIWGPAKSTNRELKKGIWTELPRWNERAMAEGVRRRVFVQSMSDFFEDHPDVVEWRERAWELMFTCSHLDYQILTKRPENVLRMVPPFFLKFWPVNFWIGTSVEDQKRANERIPHLWQIPAAVRFLSCEPLLGQINLAFLDVDGIAMSALHGGRQTETPWNVNWVIVGGESGPGKRPMSLNWARLIRDDCRRAGVPFFMKQIDKVQPIPEDLMIREFPMIGVPHA